MPLKKSVIGFSFAWFDMSERSCAGRSRQHVPGHHLEDGGRERHEETPFEAARPERLEHEKGSQPHSAQQRPVRQRKDVIA
jgi:hypothetical protein